MIFQFLLTSCALDESSLSIERVKKDEVTIRKIVKYQSGQFIFMLETYFTFVVS